MAEYIDREAVIATACKGCNKEFPNEPCEPADCYIQQGLFAIPAADVVEVRHGKWLPDYEIFVNEPFDTTPHRIQTGWKCSLCGRVECAKEPYCHCGAKMDGKGDTDG